MTVASRSDPTPEAALEFIESEMAADAMITIVGECIVDYTGRTDSFLPAGERLVVLKPDGTLLVHRMEKRTPVNWQPPGCIHQPRVEDGVLSVQSTRRDPEEVVDIEFRTILQVTGMRLADGRELELVGTEEDLRQRILADPTLIEAGFTPQDTERWNVAGPADIYGEDADGRPVIVELKRRRVGPDAVSQLKRYVDEFVRDTGHEDVRGIVVAESLTENAKALADREDLEFIPLAPPEDSPTGTTATLDEFGG
ncbi:MAG: endonuclease NucS [Halobacteriaceae archaeon]